MPPIYGTSTSGTRTAPSRGLVVLDHRDQRAADREARAVERVDEARARLLARGVGAAGRKRVFIRRAWKSVQVEQDEISR